MYEYKKIKTSVPVNSNHELKSFEELADVTKTNLGDALAIFYFDFGIRWAMFENGNFEFYDKTEELGIQFMQEARIFSKEKEIFLRRNSDKSFFCRLRVDGEGEEIDIIEANQLLLGKSKSGGEFTEMLESSGGSGFIPLEISKDKRATILTRNYIGYADNMLAGFIDSRFVKIEEV